MRPFIEKKALLAAAFISHMYTHFQRIFFGSCHFIIQKYMEGHACHISTQENLRSACRQKYTHSFYPFFFFMDISCSISSTGFKSIPRCYWKCCLYFNYCNSGMKFLSCVTNGLFVSILVNSNSWNSRKQKRKTYQKHLPVCYLFVCHAIVTGACIGVVKCSGEFFSLFSHSEWNYYCITLKRSFLTHFCMQFLPKNGPQEKSGHPKLVKKTSNSNELRKLIEYRVKLYNAC